MVEDVLDVPPRVLELLETFLSASSRGEHALLILETRKTSISMKYRSVETVTGPSATTSPSAVLKKKMNPARARRSKARLELFLKKKDEERNQELSIQVIGESATSEVAGAANYNTRKVVTDMAEEISAIPQLDGVCERESPKNESREVFSFKSDFTEEDIKNQLDEIFKNTNEISTKIILRDQLGPRMYLYTLELKMDKGKTQKASFSWPQMSSP